MGRRRNTGSRRSPRGRIPGRARGRSSRRGGRGPVAAAGAVLGGTPGRDRAPPGCGVTAGHREPPGATGTQREAPGAAPRPRGAAAPGGAGRHQERPRCRSAAAAPAPGSAERGQPARPRHGARRPRGRLAPGRDPAGGRGHLDGGRGRGLPVVRGQERLVAPRLRLRVLHLLLRHLPPALLLPGPAAAAHRAPAAPLPRLQPQDDRGHRLGRGAFHRHRHHHRVLLHVLLLLPVPAAAETAHPALRPGDPPVQLPPCSSPRPVPHGPQSRPRAPPARLHPHGHVPPARPRAVPHVPLGAPRLQPHSTPALRAGTAHLSRSLSPPRPPHPPPASGAGLGTPVPTPPRLRGGRTGLVPG